MEFLGLEETAELYQPCEAEQMTLPELASCLSVKAFLKMCNIDYQVLTRCNAEFISPGGRLSKLPVMRIGSRVVAEFIPILDLITNNEDDNTRAIAEHDEHIDIRAQVTLTENTFTLAEYYMCFNDRRNFEAVTKKKLGSMYPWLLKFRQSSRKVKYAKSVLKAYQWKSLNVAEVLERVEGCCKVLTHLLEHGHNGPFFYGNEPSELDAVVFGHLTIILETELPNNCLAKTVLQYPRLVDFCSHVGKIFFKKK